MKKILFLLLTLCSTYGMLQTAHAQGSCSLFINGESPMEIYYTDQLPLVLSGEPVGGTFAGVSIEDSIFNPMPEELPGLFSIVYTAPDGCATFEIVEIMSNGTVLSTSSIVEVERPTIFPSPFVDQLNLHLNDWKTKVETINIYTIDGQLIYSLPSNQQDFIQINTAHLNLSNGRYILLLEGKEQRHALPIMHLSKF